MRALLPAAATLLLLSGCGLIYRSNVYQGNLLEEKAIAQLAPGLSKRQVLLLLGSPAVEDPFHHARWDYVASIRRGRGDTEVRNLTLHFEGDSLVRWDGEHFPEQDLALMQELRPYGNLPKDKDKEQGRGGR